MVTTIQALAKLDSALLIEEIMKEYLLDEFGIRDLNVSSRVLQHWSEYGILPNKRRDTDENHKFNFAELIWLKIVIELRELGLSLSKIKTAKSWLLKEITLAEMFQIKEGENVTERLYEIWAYRIKDKKAFFKAYSDKKVVEKIQKRKFPLLLMYVFVFITYRKSFKTIVFKSGEAFIFHPEFYQDDKTIMNLLETEPYIIVPFLKIFKEFIEDDRYYDFISRAKILDDNELLLLTLLREKRAEKITIHYKNGKPQVIEVKEHKNVMRDARLSEVILNRGYQELTVKTNGGNISFSSITTKHFLK
jgi:DNA-binding transcriptional MerR regulator